MENRGKYLCGMVLFYQVKDCGRWLLQARYQSRLARQLDGERMVWVFLYHCCNHNPHLFRANNIKKKKSHVIFVTKVATSLTYNIRKTPHYYFLSRQCSGNDSNYCNSFLPAQNDSLNQNVATKEALT